MARMGLLTSLDQLRAWAAKRIAPRPPAPPAVPNETPESRAETREARRGTYAPPWLAGQRELSPAEKARRQQSADLLERQLATLGPAGWASDHAEEANQCSGWTYVAVDARATRVAGATLEVFRQAPGVANEEGQAPVRPDHPLVRLLRRPNPKYGLRGLLYRIEMQLRLTGTALVWAPKNGLGLPGRLWVLPTATARPQPPSAEYPEGSYLVSVISLTQWAFFGASYWNTPVGAPLVIDARDVIRHGYPHPVTEADGLSPVNANGQAIDVYDETERALWSMLMQGPMPAGILSIDKEMKVDDGVAEELAAETEAKFGGAANAGKFMAVQGATFQAVSMSPSAIIPEGFRQENRGNVLAAHGVPPIAAGQEGATAYSGLYAALQQFDTNQIEPELDLLGDDWTIQIANRYYGDDLVVRLKPKPINDHELKFKEAQQKKDSGCYTVDEIRACYGDKQHHDPEFGRSTAGQPPAPEPAPGANPLADLAGGGATGTAAGEADESGTGQASPVRRSQPTGQLAALRGKGLASALPPAPTTHLNGWAARVRA